MAAMAGAAPIRSQEPGASSWSPMWVQGPNHLGHPPLPSQATAESWTGRGATGTRTRRRRQRINQVSHGAAPGASLLTSGSFSDATGPDSSQDECKAVKWCALSHHERLKCDEWSVTSGGKIECESAETTEDCIAKIMNGEADAMSLDGGYVYIAGQCGLVPVLAENYESTDCRKPPEEGYLSVAVVKKSNPDINWNNLEGKKSCHTAVDRTAGWNIPMGLLYNRINHCRFDEFFRQGCAPGSQKNSSLCELCVGPSVCAPNNREGYYGYTGAFRCLVEKGDVAFVKSQTVLQNTGGQNSEPWAKDLKAENFELLCLDGTRKPVSEAHSCHLAKAPNHAVVSRKDKAACVKQKLLDLQVEYGSTVADCSRQFCMFHSETKDLLFRDDTKCLVDLRGKNTYEKYLGADYIKAVSNLRKCSTSRLLEACTFHKH